MGGGLGEGTLTRFSLQLAPSTRRIKFRRRDSCQFLQLVLISNSLSLNRNSCHLDGIRERATVSHWRGEILREEERGCDECEADGQWSRVRGEPFSLINPAI